MQLKQSSNEVLSHRDIHTIYFQGVLYHRWKKLDKAVESYRKALALDPENQSAKNNLKRLVVKKL